MKRPVKRQLNVILTRYLYNKSAVVLSLRNAIHAASYDQSAFWAYELYYSGFQEETIEILLDIYNKRFSARHPKLGLYIRKKLALGTDERIATIVKNLTMKKPDIAETADVKFVNVKAYHIEPYKTVPTNRVKYLWKYLRTVCKYAVCKDKLQKKDADIRRTIFCKKWLYAASHSPIWKDRILEHNGIIEHDNQTVRFVSDDDLEAFHDLYGFDTEEQPLELQIRCMGF